MTELRVVAIGGRRRALTMPPCASEPPPRSAAGARRFGPELDPTYGCVDWYCYERERASGPAAAAANARQKQTPASGKPAG
jgi:hypothetical protein